ncbi:MAG: NAD(P)/FAD-dependent oxidoreductase, partial [Acidobacteriota bacterium]
MRYDVVIIGGGAIGACVAYYLRTHRTPCTVAVIERDPAYTLASTPRASGGVRRLFSLPENIALSQYSIGFFEEFETRMAVAGEAARIGFKKGGYLFIVPPAAVATLAENFETQRRYGVNVLWLEPAALQSRFPSMRVADLGAGVYSPDDGWLDPHSVLQGFRRKARDLGAEFVADEAVAIDAERGVVRAVRLKSGHRIETGAVINAAGAWAKEVCAMVGMRVPIEPMRRYEHYFECTAAIEPLPYVKDPNRLAFRPEGKGYS